MTAVVLALTAAASALPLMAPASPLRTAVALVFMLTCPGLAWVRFAGIPDALTRISLAVALSIAIDTAVASALVYTEHWSPGAGLGILVAVTLVGLALAAARPSLAGSEQRT